MFIKSWTSTLIVSGILLQEVHSVDLSLGPCYSPTTMFVTALPGRIHPSASNSAQRSTTQLHQLCACMHWNIFSCQYKAVGNSQSVCRIVIQLFCFPFLAYRIHVSQSTVDTLRSLNEGYEIVPRGRTELKVRRSGGLCEMLRREIFFFKEFSY